MKKDKEKELEKLYENSCKLYLEILIKTKGRFNGKEFDEVFIQSYGDGIKFSKEEVKEFIDKQND